MRAHSDGFDFVEEEGVGRRSLGVQGRRRGSFLFFATHHVLILVRIARNGDFEVWFGLLFLHINIYNQITSLEATPVYLIGSDFNFKK